VRITNAKEKVKVHVPKKRRDYTGRRTAVRERTRIVTGQAFIYCGSSSCINSPGHGGGDQLPRKDFDDGRAPEWVIK
jgi:hypothetical protein